MWFIAITTFFQYAYCFDFCLTRTWTFNLNYWWCVTKLLCLVTYSFVRLARWRTQCLKLGYQIIRFFFDLNLNLPFSFQVFSWLFLVLCSVLFSKGLQQSYWIYAVSKNNTKRIRIRKNFRDRLGIFSTRYECLPKHETSRVMMKVILNLK